MSLGARGKFILTTLITQLKTSRQDHRCVSWSMTRVKVDYLVAVRTQIAVCPAYLLAITSKRGQVTNSGDHGRGR
ncbi:MAG: hypothetical protein U0359_40750, partial [Byssovorax sp.]